MQKVNRPS